MICTCSQPGFCSVYQKVQTEKHWKICRGELLTPEQCEVYKANWDRMKGITGDASYLVLSPAELKELFPGDNDPTLIGNKFAALTKQLGIPPCGGCESRRVWINKAHLVLRGIFGSF